MIIKKTINHAHLYCGSGGGAKGFNKGQAKVGNYEAEFECLGGIDVDAAACRDFANIADAPATCIDLFSREQYIAFHGHEPPADWREAVPDDIRRAFGNKHPHVLFLSAPCKGFSGLLSEKMSAAAKYQALNGLTLRGIFLALEAYRDDPVELIVFENVPRIATRGRHLLDHIAGLARPYGYAIAETDHDCGEIGNLAQSRKRFLMVMRFVEKVPCFLYEPVKHRLRGVGQVLETLPLPGIVPGLGGPMHRMPSLQWKTWVRLAFVCAGADWRSLNELRVDNGTLLDFGIAMEGAHHGVYGARDWDQAAATVTGASRPANGSHAIADPRVFAQYNGDVLGVRRWDEPTGTVPGRSYPNCGAHSVADPRLEEARNTSHGVADWREPSMTVRGEAHPTNGTFVVADPRVDGHAKSVQLGVRNWNEPAGVVTGKMFAGGGPNSVADPRLPAVRFNHAFRIVQWGEASPAVAGPGGAAGGLAVADPRAGDGRHVNGKYRITAFDEPANAVIGASTTGNGAFAVADPRPGFGPATHHHVLKVTPWDRPGGTVTASSHPAGGALSVADPRTGYGPNSHRNKLAVVDWDKNAGTVTGSDRVGSGALSVADPRPDFLQGGERMNYQTAGNYGVVPWNDPTGAIAAHGQHDNGRWSVADPRAAEYAPDGPVYAETGSNMHVLPPAAERLVCVIRALDGTWHRPFTTLELAALQGLVDPDEQLVLDGMSDSAWRERIGNMVPPPSAAAIAGVCGVTLLAAWSGQTFMMGSTPIWVRPVAAALMAAT